MYGIPALIRQQHSNPPAGTEERLLRLVGSFPEARLVLGEVTENLCVRG